MKVRLASVALGGGSDDGVGESLTCRPKPYGLDLREDFRVGRVEAILATTPPLTPVLLNERREICEVIS